MEVVEEPLDAVLRCSVSFDLALPAAGGGVVVVDLNGSAADLGWVNAARSLPTSCRAVPTPRSDPSTARPLSSARHWAGCGPTRSPHRLRSE
jgi:hypothetical protein